MPNPGGTGRPAQRAWAAVAAVTVLNLPLGSIYAFSVFLEPIEHDLAIGRSALSLVFGLASSASPSGRTWLPTFGKAPAWALVAISIAGAAIGIGLTASARVWPAW